MMKSRFTQWQIVAMLKEGEASVSIDKLTRKPDQNTFNLGAGSRRRSARVRCAGNEWRAPMPWFNLRGRSDADLAAIYARHSPASRC
jgi:hypothetical protein